MPNINKVVLGDVTLIDLTTSTLSSTDQLLQGVTAFDRGGNLLTGTATGGGTEVVTIEDTTDSHGGTVRTITALDISDTTATASDVINSKWFYAADGTRTQGTGSGGITPTGNINITQSGQTDVTNYATATVAAGTATAPSTITGTSATVSTGTNTLTLSKTVSVTPSVTTAGYISSGTAGNANVSLTASVTTQAAQTIYPSTSDQTINSGRYLTGTQTIKGVAVSNTLTADNIKSGVTITIGDSADADRITSVTGTYSGGGTSKNTQVVQSTTRTNSSSMTALSAELTVSKTGTYDIYYSATRTNTSSSYTWATQLYKDGTAQGTENTTWSNNVQNVHLTNQSLTANQKLRVYGRQTRGSSYYVCAPMLAIVES